MSPGTGKTFVGGLLGTGVLAQLLTVWFATSDADLAMLALLGFSIGGLVGLIAGIFARTRNKDGIPEVLIAREGGRTQTGGGGGGGGGGPGFGIPGPDKRREPP